MAKNKIGRPSIFSEEICNLICEQMTNGYSLSRICENPDVPSLTTVMRWLADSEKDGASKELVYFRENYIQARQRLADYWLDEGHRRAIDNTGDTVVDGDGNLHFMSGNVAARKLAYEASFKYAEKLAPNKYGVQRVESSLSDSSIDAISALLDAVQGCDDKE